MTGTLTYEHFFYAPDKARADALAAVLQQQGALVPEAAKPSARTVERHLVAMHNVRATDIRWQPDVEAAYGCSHTVYGEHLLMAYTDYLIAPEDEERWRAICAGYRTLAAEHGCEYDGGGCYIGSLPGTEAAGD